MVKGVKFEVGEIGDGKEEYDENEYVSSSKILYEEVENEDEEEEGISK
jgi:hypothetical protein